MIIQELYNILKKSIVPKIKQINYFFWDISYKKKPKTNIVIPVSPLHIIKEVRSNSDIN